MRSAAFDDSPAVPTGRPAELLGGAQQLPVLVPRDRTDGFLATRRRHDRNADLLGLGTVDVGHRLLVMDLLPPRDRYSVAPPLPPVHHARIPAEHPGEAVMADEASDTTRWTRATVYPDMWVDPDDDPRETDAQPVDERGILLDYLRTYRLTFEMKCAGLNAEQMARRSVPSSTMSLLGLVRHPTEDERYLRR